MKQIFFVAISATLLAAGCQKTEVINPVGEPAMSFTTGAKKLTKGEGTADAAATDKDQNLKAQDFRVWAYAAEEYDHTPTPDINLIYDGMENLPVTYDSANGWSTTSQHFWPGKEKAIAVRMRWLDFGVPKNNLHIRIYDNTDM
jgi:opacity protein-like surface antigen